MRNVKKIITFTGVFLAMMAFGSSSLVMADDWMDSMGEGSGISRQVAGSASPQNVEAMREAVENTMDHSFDFNKQVNSMKPPQILVVSNMACGDGPCDGDELDFS